MLAISLLRSASTPLVAILILGLILGFYLLGHRLRRSVLKKNPAHAEVDLGRINGTLLGLLGLLLAFTFGMANARFDTRRELVIQEANDIGTVILRTDVYPDSVRSLLRATLKDYLEARIAYYQAGTDDEKTIANFNRADVVGKKVWSMVASYARKDDVTTRTSQMIPALNDMLDITTTRIAASESTIPDSIMYFLFITCVSSAFLLGYDHKDKTDWVIVMGFALMLSATVYSIIDLDRPRSGLINLDAPNEKIVELRQMFDAH